MNGWIKIHREIINWEWYNDVNTSRLFLHCLLKANHADKNYRGTVVKAGSFLTCRDLLSSQTGLSVRQIRTSLSRLKSTNELTINTSRQGTVIEVVNYDKFQETTDKTTNKRPISDQQATSNKNDKNKKNYNIFVHQKPSDDLAKPSSSSKKESDDLSKTEKKVEKCPYREIVTLYNKILGDELTRCRVDVPSRRQAIRATWAFLCFKMDQIEKYFKKVKESDFLCGRCKNSTWKCDFDWIMKQKNLIKIVEGNYDND